jgi:hypothetical protein
MMGRHFISRALFGLTGYRDSYKSGINTILYWNCASDESVFAGMMYH